MIFFTRKNNPAKAFQPADFVEALENVKNPGRGWYRIYTYTLGEGETCDLPPVLSGEDALALVFLDIGAYQEKPLDKQALEKMDAVLSAFAQAGVDMLLRIAYDKEGKGMEKEPFFYKQVQEHIRQISPLLIRYAEAILLVQGQLVGSWGEMHTSKFLTEKHIPQSAEAFLQLTERKVRFSVRKPLQYRLIQEQDNWENGRLPIGIFDDAIFASPTHLGTFGEEASLCTDWKSAWQPEAEISFMKSLAKQVPFGGEALQGEALTVEETVQQLKELQITYLNCIHDERRLSQWKQQQWKDGRSLYDYITAHLGYRFVAEQAAIEKKGKETILSLRIVNHGFACAAEEIDFCLYARTKEQGEKASDTEENTGKAGFAEREFAEADFMKRGSSEAGFLETDFRGTDFTEAGFQKTNLGQLCGGDVMEIQVPIEEVMKKWKESTQPKLYFYASLQRKRGKKCVRFANAGAGEDLLLGVLQGQSS